MSDRDDSRIAAHMLVGLELDGGWRVVEKIERSPDATGGAFSVGYVVERSGTRAYLKALDYSFAFQPEAGNTAQVLEAMTSAYNFEVEVLRQCAEKRMDRIVRALGQGELVVDGADGFGNVSYLIFELADGDIRHALDSVGALFDYAWSLRMLHQAATGLWQMHGNDLAHQDLKPSNVLTFGRGSNKLADLGRASRRGQSSPHDDFACAGDPLYAPPELLYGHVSAEWVPRRQACDMYLLGSLIMFTFSGATATAAMFLYLDDAQRPEEWRESFSAVLPYLRVAWDSAVADFEEGIPNSLVPHLVPMVRQLSDPDPKLRGHPRSRASHGNPYSLERYVSELNLLASRAEVGTYQDVA
jgi:eukaryotic-like serine/threonine-protein kinase